LSEVNLSSEHLTRTYATDTQGLIHSLAVFGDETLWYFDRRCQWRVWYWLWETNRVFDFSSYADRWFS
jgi:hypothetical protein